MKRLKVFIVRLIVIYRVRVFVVEYLINVWVCRIRMVMIKVIFVLWYVVLILRINVFRVINVFLYLIRMVM